MKRTVAIFAVAVLVLTPVLTYAAPPAKKPGAKKPAATPEAQAQQAARAWLALVDAGKYDASWDTAASMFRSAVTKAQWAAAAQQARGPLGKLQTRRLQSVQWMKSAKFGGATPDGPYVVIVYAATFAARPATETAVFMRDTDGKWKAAGYFVK